MTNFRRESRYSFNFLLKSSQSFSSIEIESSCEKTRKLVSDEAGLQGRQGQVMADGTTCRGVLGAAYHGRGGGHNRLELLQEETRADS